MNAPSKVFAFRHSVLSELCILPVLFLFFTSYLLNFHIIQNIINI